ncbi:MAG: phosphodiester glycosidase family protein [bacterium]|nr:phosphodiester glycosidase family protein [Candidatus Kapabacteria bacterium]
MLLPLLFVASLLTAPDFNPTNAAPPDSVVRDGARAPGDSVMYGELTDGASYRRIRNSRGVILHVLSIDLSKGLTVEAIKARDSYDGLETLTEMYERAERQAKRDGDTVLAAINAGPWHAERLTPIGPLVVDGDVVELATDDAWSSLLLYNDKAAISRDRVSGGIHWRHRHIDVQSVNRRANSKGLVVYNAMYGATVPDTVTKSENQIVADIVANAAHDDTGIDFDVHDIDSVEIIRRYRYTRRFDHHQEQGAFKVAVRRLQTARSNWFGEPRINDTMWTMVVKVDTGAIAVPHDGYVISPGSNEDWFRSARYGDTVRLHFQVARNGIGTIHDVVPGYPQLLFEGSPAPEPDFAQGPAAAVRPDDPGARTAVGITKGGNTMLLVAVEAPTDEGAGGLTIDELASTMRTLGAHDAIAMEGHASSSMVVNYEAVTHGADANALRRISNALVVKKKRRW